MDFGIFAALVFVLSLAGIAALRWSRRRGEVESQFVVTGALLLLVFYVVGILSGLCTIVNFLFKWAF